MTAEVVFLEFRTTKITDDVFSFLSCVSCKNKTFTLVQDAPGRFPLMRCAACGEHIGRVGWAHDADPAADGTPGESA